MPRSISVRPFEQSDISAAAGYLAARHRAGRTRFPLLPGRFENEDACNELLRSVTRFARGYAAQADGTLAGFLFGIQNLPAPTSTSARFGPERGSMMFAHGHAVAPESDPGPIYNAVFAAFAVDSLRDGIFDHSAHVPSGDRVVEQAWVDLGFGRATAVAARDTSPLAAPPAMRDVRRATLADLDVVCAIGDAGDAYHSGPPMFNPYAGKETAEAGREDMRASLADETQAIFIGFVDGEPAGILRVEPPKGSPLFVPDNACYIGDTAVLAEARGTGLGGALLEEALAWARSQHFAAVTLHYQTANPLSSAFWTGHGFKPVMYHLRRRLDERIAWARPS